MPNISKKVVNTSCPRDCYSGCGISVSLNDGVIASVTGNKDHPSNKGPLCMKCTVAYNGVWLDEEARLLHPLKRIGPKGAGQFEQVSWEEALSTIADRLQTIIDDKGADKIYHNHYTGTCSLLGIDFPNRFFDHIGATNIDSDTVCNKAGHVALNYVLGDSLNGFDPRTIKDSNCVLVWGANPSVSGPHVDKHWLYGNDVKVIVIDPIRHETAEKADMHLQIRPGADASLAFGMLHVMKREGLIDAAFIEKHVIGYDDVIEMINASTPEWTEQQCDVPAALIEEAALIYGKGPSILWLGQGLQRQPSGGNVIRACAMLPAFTGNIGKAGTGIYYLNDIFSMASRKGDSPTVEASNEEENLMAGQMDMPDLLNDPGSVAAYMVWNSNPVASNPNQAKTIQGLSRDDLFTVVVDCFQTDSAQYADVILPAASFLEFDDICGSYFQLIVGPQVKVSEPMGKSLPNQEIFRRLARAMKLEGDELFVEDIDFINSEMKSMDIGCDWDGLKEKGWSYITPKPIITWADGNYPTPSGKIEIASLQAVEDGFTLTPTRDADDRPSNGAYRLLSPADKFLMNSSYGNDARLIKRMGDAQVMINPADASASNIQSGDKVTLSNAAGELTLMVNVTDITPKGTLMSAKSRWLMNEGAKANINILHMAQKSDMGESSSVHGIEVLLKKV